MSRLVGLELAGFHSGDGELFRRLVEQHSPRLLAIARSFAADVEEAHDLVQETWRRAFEKRRTYRGSGTLSGWLYAVCRSVCLAATEKRTGREGTPLDAEFLSGPAARDPQADAERAVLRASIHRSLLGLPGRERDLVILRLLEGWSTRETAAALGIAEGTVKAGLHHALEKLRVSMKGWVR